MVKLYNKYYSNSINFNLTNLFFTSWKLVAFLLQITIITCRIIPIAVLKRESNVNI
jgi:hypothetical protein